MEVNDLNFHGAGYCGKVRSRTGAVSPAEGTGAVVAVGAGAATGGVLQCTTIEALTTRLVLANVWPYALVIA